LVHGTFAENWTFNNNCHINCQKFLKYDFDITEYQITNHSRHKGNIIEKDSNTVFIMNI